MNDLFWLTDEQTARLEPSFPRNHGKPRVDDRRVLSGIIFVNRNGLRWRDAPKDHGPHKRLCCKHWGAARGTSPFGGSGSIGEMLIEHSHGFGQG